MCVTGHGACARVALLEPLGDARLAVELPQRVQRDAPRVVLVILEHAAGEVGPTARVDLRVDHRLLLPFSVRRVYDGLIVLVEEPPVDELARSRLQVERVHVRRDVVRAEPSDAL
eukprot:848950-Prymnesium_polylepis.1